MLLRASSQGGREEADQSIPQRGEVVLRNLGDLENWEEVLRSEQLLREDAWRKNPVMGLKCANSGRRHK